MFQYLLYYFRFLNTGDNLSGGVPPCHHTDHIRHCYIEHAFQSLRPVLHTDIPSHS
jgi:hypothetical protein